MELSPPLRWLGALAVMLVVLLIVVPMLLQTAGDLVVIGDDATEGLEEASETPDDAASEPVADGDGAVAGSGGGGQGGGGGGGGGGNGGGQGGGGGGGNGGGNGDFPATYTVAAGDTGSTISEQFYGDSAGWSAIAEANDIDPSAPLRVGLELTIPPPQ